MPPLLSLSRLRLWFAGRRLRRAYREAQEAERGGRYLTAARLYRELGEPGAEARCRVRAIYQATS